MLTLRTLLVLLFIWNQSALSAISLSSSIFNRLVRTEIVHRNSTYMENSALLGGNSIGKYGISINDISAVDALDTDIRLPSHGYLEIAGSDSLIESSNKKVIASGVKPKHWQRLMKTAFYFFLWYFFTVVYNISNKFLLNQIPAPLTVATLQLLLGIPLFLPLWAMKPIKYNWSELSNHLRIASMHGLGSWASVAAYGSGSVSFAQVIKALEPVVAAILSAIITRETFSAPVYLAIIPIVAGVGVASATEITFTWLGFFYAMLSNIFYQMRMVLAKREMNEESTSISPANMFRVITILASLELIPITLIFEGFSFLEKWNDAIAHGANRNNMLSNLLISGGSFYMYNEVAFWLLEIIHPVTHAVGNTVKRVVIILASVIILKSPVSAVGMIGAMVAVLGTLVYSLAQQRSKSNVS